MTNHMANSFPNINFFQYKVLAINTKPFNGIKKKKQALVSNFTR